MFPFFRRVSILYQANYNPQIGRNMIKGFKEIHTKGMFHEDVRGENILDHSVVIDFEMSKIDAKEDLKVAMRKFKNLLASLL